VTPFSNILPAFHRIEAKPSVPATGVERTFALRAISLVATPWLQEEQVENATDRDQKTLACGSEADVCLHARSPSGLIGLPHSPFPTAIKITIAGARRDLRPQAGRIYSLAMSAFGTGKH
jgi:hypothetical protein